MQQDRREAREARRDQSLRITARWLAIACVVLAFAAGAAFTYARRTVQWTERELGRDYSLTSPIRHRKAKEPEPKRGIHISPFLTLPFPKGTPWEILRGWVNNPQQAQIYGERPSYTLYIGLPAGTPILASVPGKTLGSHHSYSQRNYQGRPVVEGLGNFVQTYVPELGIFVEYGLLTEINENIPVHQPEHYKREGVPDTYDPKFIYKLCTNDDFESLSYSYVEVERGQEIGYVLDGNPHRDGQGGCTDICLRFEVFTRRQNDGRKDLRFDPFGIRGQASDYNDLSELSLESLWLTNSDGGLIHADEEL